MNGLKYKITFIIMCFGSLTETRNVVMYNELNCALIKFDVISDFCDYLMRAGVIIEYNVSLTCDNEVLRSALRKV